MGRITINLIKQIRQWDTPSKIALGAALIGLVLTMLMAATSPSETRTLAVIGFVGMVFVLQIIMLWGNRGLVKPFTAAQRLYLAGDLEKARDILMPICEDDSADFQELTLLGNIYRQLGELDKSGALLQRALDKESEHFFPLYGFGLTLLARGDYLGAVKALEQALSYKDTSAIRFDYAHALYRAGDEAASQQMQAVLPELKEPYRELMARYILYLSGQSASPYADLIHEGIVFWQASAQRFAQTPYGQELAQDVQQILNLIEEA